MTNIPFPSGSSLADCIRDSGHEEGRRYIRKIANTTGGIKFAMDRVENDIHGV
jgi:hypothetical protein